MPKAPSFYIVYVAKREQAYTTIRAWGYVLSEPPHTITLLLNTTTSQPGAHLYSILRTPVLLRLWKTGTALYILLWISFPLPAGLRPVHSSSSCRFALLIVAVLEYVRVCLSSVRSSVSDRLAPFILRFISGCFYFSFILFIFPILIVVMLCSRPQYAGSSLAWVMNLRLFLFSAILCLSL